MKPHKLQLSRPILAWIIVFASFSLILLGCGKKAPDKIDFGSVAGSVYQNKYLGFMLTAPPTWSFQNQDAQREAMRKGQALVSGGDKNLSALMDAAKLQTVNLFAVSKFPLGAAVTYNPALIAAAEYVGNLPGIQRGKDYLFHARQGLQATTMQVSFPRDMYTVELGKVSFDVMEVEIALLGKKVREKFYSTIRRGYALFFVMAFTNDDDESTERRSLETIVFK
jgi:hypothetical protein